MGLARSGKAAVSSLMLGGARVLAWDDNPKRRKEVSTNGVEVRDLHSINFEDLDALVLSPGIPHSFPKPHPVAAKAKASGVPIIGDIDIFAKNFKNNRIIGVTGTNGKSTTTALIGHVLSHSNISNEVAGNIGRPVLEMSSDTRPDFIVLELSSYQLELSPSLACSIAVLLNITPDHLDRHGGMEGYVRAKRRIFDNLSYDPKIIIGTDDEITRSICHQFKHQSDLSVIPISGYQIPENGVGVESGNLRSKLPGIPKCEINLNEMKTLIGVHNHQNAAAAIAIALSLGIEQREIESALKCFEGLPHRQELVRELFGINFINDSKATNFDATERALSSFKSIYWIAGGLSKKERVTKSFLKKLENVEHAFLIGSSENEFFDVFKSSTPCTKCRNLEIAVKKAALAACSEKKESPVVLLSPAAASFDQFESYEERGDQFKSIVGSLNLEKSSSWETTT